MFTNPTRAVEATRTLEFDHPSVAWSLADDIADRIAAACHPVELHDIHRNMWFRMRLEALQTRRTETRPKPRAALSSAPRASARRPQRSPDRQASIERRRRMVGTIAMPPSLAAKFTWGEVAALRVIGDEVKRHGACSLYIDASLFK